MYKRSFKEKAPELQMSHHVTNESSCDKDVVL